MEADSDEEGFAPADNEELDEPIDFKKMSEKMTHMRVDRVAHAEGGLSHAMHQRHKEIEQLHSSEGSEVQFVARPSTSSKPTTPRAAMDLVEEPRVDRVAHAEGGLSQSMHQRHKEIEQLHSSEGSEVQFMARVSTSSKPTTPRAAMDLVEEPRAMTPTHKSSRATTPKAVDDGEEPRAMTPTLKSSKATTPRANDEFDEPRAYPLEAIRKKRAPAGVPVVPQNKPMKRNFEGKTPLATDNGLPITETQVEPQTVDEDGLGLPRDPRKIHGGRMPVRKRPPPLRVSTAVNDMRMVEEIEFIFDGTFHVNGFQISRAGIQETPKNLSRNNNTDLYEDVPSSKRTFVVVTSFAELELTGEKLGSGASGYVRLARHKPSNCTFAVKVVDVQKRGNRDQIEKELRTLMIHKNPFVVRFFQAFYNGAGAVHMVLEYMDCGSLKDAIKKHGAISESVMKIVALHCLRGLRSLHENQILHRDLKSANILLSASSQRAKLSDFGIAKQLARSGEDRTKTFVGTLDYMSPERLVGKDYTYASDVWGLGITLAESLQGRHPKTDEGSLNKYYEQKAILMDPARFSRECCDFVRICTHEAPERRPSAAQLIKHPWVVSDMDRCRNDFTEWLKGLIAERRRPVEKSSPMTLRQ